MDESKRYPYAILVVDDEPGMLNFLQRALTSHCALVEVADSVEAAEKLRERYHFDLLIVDIRLSEASGVEWLQQLRDRGSREDVIFMTAYADLDTAIAALRTGAADFVLKPFRLEQIMAAVERCLEHRKMARENFLLRREVSANAPMDGMVGRSEAMDEIYDMITRVAPTRSIVLIEGETGSGKELVARAIHKLSGRGGAFVPLNCGFISPDLLESELFGHVKGAFTGAQNSRDGLFTYAHDGTLFLDEISEMQLPLQAKLLRVLEQHTVRPVGSDQEVPVNARVVAATNHRLKDEVTAGNFREDLYYRLNVLRIVVPPLRERRDDIPELAEHFSNALAVSMGMQPIPFEHADLVRMQQYSWPGNVRELRNVIERSLLLGKLPNDCCVELQDSTARVAADSPMSGEMPVNWKLADVEKHHILRVLVAAGGNKSEAARRLGVSRKTLERKLALWREATAA